MLKEKSDLWVINPMKIGVEWSREIGIPEGGILIRPDEGDVLRYLQRYRRFS